MKFFIDTANLKEIETAASWGILDGVTTNPSLMAREGIKGHDNILKHYVAICNLVEGDVSAEVIATDYAGMMREAEMLAALHKNIVVKVPMTKDGIKAIRTLNQQGIRTNCTLVFSTGQAILAAKAGATYVSPFVGRLDDISADGMSLISQMVNVFSIQEYETQILAASLRHPMHIVQCAEMGANVVTCPFKSIEQLFHHPLTDLGLEKFMDDYRKSQQ